MYLQLEDVASLAERVVVPYRMQLYRIRELVSHIFIIYSGLFKAKLWAEQHTCEVAIIGSGVVLDPVRSSQLSSAAELDESEGLSTCEIVCESDHAVVYRLPRSELIRILHQTDTRHAKSWDKWCTRRSVSWKEQQCNATKQ